MMTMRRLLSLPAVLLPALVPVAARAQQPVSLESSVFVEKVSTDVNGRERRVLSAPRRIGAGDRLVFVVRYRNSGAAPVSGFAVTNPVPAAIRIDAADPSMQVSVDGGASWGQLRDLSVRTPLGGARRATADDVTHVRWAIRAPVQPGDAGRISYRGTVR